MTLASASHLIEKPFRPMAAATQDDRDALLRDPELLDALRSVVKKSIPEQDVEDVFNAVWIEARESKDLPLERGPCKGFLIVLGQRRVVDYWRARGRSLEEATDQIEYVAAACPQDAVEARDLYTKLANDTDPDKRQTFWWLARRAMGEEIRKIAREADLDYDVVRKRMETLRAELKGKALLWAAAVAVLAIVVGSAWLIFRPKQQIAHDKEQQPAPTLNETAPTAPLPPPAPPAPPPLSPAEQAHQLRSFAYRECVADFWRECLAELDQAKQIDPDGEKDPLVKAARKDATEGLKHDPKLWGAPRNRPYEQAAAPPIKF